MIANVVQIVCKGSETGTAGTGCVTFVQAMIQTMVIQTVDVSFDPTMPVGWLVPSLVTLVLLVGGTKFVDWIVNCKH